MFDCLSSLDDIFITDQSAYIMAMSERERIRKDCDSFIQYLMCVRECACVRAYIHVYVYV